MTNTGLVKVKQERLVKPHGGGILGRLIVTAGGVTIGYLLLPTVPLASIAIAGALAISYFQDADKIQHPETSKRLELLLHSKTAKHPSIYESRKELRSLYPMAAVNKAIEYMLDYCEWIEFSPNSKHPLRVFGEIYAYCDPITDDIYIPIEGLKMLMTRWEIDQSQVDVLDVNASEVEPTTPVEPDSNSEPGSAGPVPDPAPDPAPAPTPAEPETETAAEEWDGVVPKDPSGLLALLKEQCPELLKLIKSPPIRLVGLQRTGKSTFARKLALLRVLFMEGHTTIWATPHREADNLVPELLNPIGTTADGAKDFGAIEAHWSATQTAIDKGQQVNLTAVWDEFGSYDSFRNLELLGPSLRSLLRESTKHGYFPILVIHGDQSLFLPGVKNILSTMQQSTIKVEAIGEQANEFGEMKPTGEVEVTWLDGAKTRFKVPEWLSVDYLLSLVKTDTKPAFLQSTGQPPNQPQQESQLDQRQRLEELFQKPPAARDSGSSSTGTTAIAETNSSNEEVFRLGAELRAYLLSRLDTPQWTSSSLKRLNKRYRQLSDEQIEGFFRIFAKNGLGYWDGKTFTLCPGSNNG